MSNRVVTDALLFVALFPFIYYCLAIFGSWRFFRPGRRHSSDQWPHMPPVSILKPVRGVDPEAYENFSSFCRQDYPEYEILYCVSDRSDPVVPVIEQVARDYPECRIRVLYGSGRVATNDKVAKLVRLVGEAQYDTLVINDSDVNAKPDYLRTMVAPLVDPKVGAVTCFYAHTGETRAVEKLQSVGMISDFYAGLLVAWLLDGVKFALGPTIATTRAHLASFGGYEVMENRPADDLLVGRWIAEKGYEVVLLPYVIQTVADYDSFRDLVFKRLRWLVVMRNLRPRGHAGLLFTLGLPWALLATALHPTAVTAVTYLGIYYVLRLLMTWTLGTWGLKERFRLRYLAYIPLWDATAAALWLTSFTRSTIRWRDLDYHIRNGELVPAKGEPLGEPSEVAKQA